MRITKISLTAGAKVCEKFQSADASATVDIYLRKGEDKELALDAVHKRLYPIVERQAKTALHDLLYRGQMDMQKD